MHLQKIHYLTFDLDQCHMKHCSVSYTLCELRYVPAKLEVATPNRFGDAFTRKLYLII